MKHITLLLFVFNFSGIAFADIPPPPPSKTCKDPVFLQGEAVTKLFEALNVPAKKENLPWDKEGGYKLMKAFSTTSGGDNVRITCTLLKDRSGKDVMYNRGRPGCVISFESSTTGKPMGNPAQE